MLQKTLQAHALRGGRFTAGKANISPLANPWAFAEANDLVVTHNIAKETSTGFNRLVTFKNLDGESAVVSGTVDQQCDDAAVTDVDLLDFLTGAELAEMLNVALDCTFDRVTAKDRRELLFAV